MEDGKGGLFYRIALAKWEPRDPGQRPVCAMCQRAVVGAIIGGMPHAHCAAGHSEKRQTIEIIKMMRPKLPLGFRVAEFCPHYREAA